MRNFNQYTIEEGLLSMAPAIVKAKRIIADISQVADRGMDAVWALLQEKYPQAWEMMQRLAKDPQAAGTLDTRMKGGGVKEGTLGGASPSYDAVGEIGRMMGSALTMGVYGVVGIVVLYLAFKWRQNIFNILSSARYAAQKAISGGEKSSTQSALDKMAKEAEARKEERARARMKREPKGRFPQAPPSQYRP